MRNQAAPLFANNWNVYQKIVFKNYMLHEEFGAATRDTILSMNSNDGLTVLDMGCGDAHQIALVLKSFNISSYTGYDLSDTALKIAAENLSGMDAEVILKQGRMEELIKNERGFFDLVYTGYAIHHLDEAGKISLLKECYDHLKPEGRFIHIDIARKEGQTRDAYIANYMNLIHSEWTLLSNEEIKLIEEHINNCDFPAEINQLMLWMEAAGFEIITKLPGDGRHCMFVLHKKQ
jgi:SAM-dependent methyltransferase